MDMIGQLTSQLGIETPKAEAGVGVLLTAIKEQAPASDSQGLFAALPESSTWMSKAASLSSGASSGSSGLGSIAGALGGGLGKMTGQAAGLASIVSLLGKLGIDAGTAAKFVPMALKLMQSKAGPGVFGKISGSVPFVSEALGAGGASAAGGLGAMLGKLGQ